MHRPFCRAPKIICLPSNSEGHFSESSGSNVGTSHRNQEANDGTNHRKLDVPPRRASFEDVPTTAHCTSCGTQVLTYTKYRTSSMTWALAGLLCAFGCHLGCCLAPFFYNSVKNVVHLCPLCSTELGIYTQEQESSPIYTNFAVKSDFEQLNVIKQKTKAITSLPIRLLAQSQTLVRPKHKPK